MDNLGNEINTRKGLLADIETKIKALESKAGDSQEIAKLCNDILDYQKSLTNSLDFHEKIISISISSIKEIVETESEALEEIREGIDKIKHMQDTPFLDSHLRQRVDRLRRNQQLLSKLREGLDNLVEALPQRVKKKDNNNGS